MADKFLNLNGLTAFYNKIKALFANKVDKEIRTETDTSTHYIKYGKNITTRNESKTNTDFEQAKFSEGSVVLQAGDSNIDLRNAIDAEGIYLNHVNLNETGSHANSAILSAQQIHIDKKQEDTTGTTDPHSYSNITGGRIATGIEDYHTEEMTDSFVLDGVNNTVSMNADLVTSFKEVLGISGGGGGDYMVKGVDHVTAGQKAGTTLGGKATAEGYNTTASGHYSHAEGGNTTASGNYSHAEGYNTTASGNAPHAEGSSTTASGAYSHAEGYNTTASGNYSHAEGSSTTASGNYSHAEGSSTTANRKSQHVFGEWNIVDNEGNGTSERGKYIEIVGNGVDANTRSNARTLDWSGNEWLAGTLKVGGTSYDDAKAVATEDNIAALQGQIDNRVGTHFQVNAEKWYGTYTDETGTTYQVYSKMIYIPALPSTAGITTYSHGISGIKQILQVYGFTTDGFVLNAPRQSAKDNISIYQMSKSASNQTLSIEVGKDRSNKAAYVCLVYAKNN